MPLISTFHFIKLDLKWRKLTLLWLGLINYSSDESLLIIYSNLNVHFQGARLWIKSFDELYFQLSNKNMFHVVFDQNWKDNRMDSIQLTQSSLRNSIAKFDLGDSIEENLHLKFKWKFQVKSSTNNKSQFNWTLSPYIYYLWESHIYVYLMPFDCSILMLLFVLKQ